MSERTPSDAGSPKVPTIPPPPTSRSAPPPPPVPPKPRAPGTILGVAPPKVTSEPAAVDRNPVFVRSESIADEELSPPAPAAFGFPAVPSGVELPPLSAAEPPTEPNPLTSSPRSGSLRAALNVPVRIAGADLPLWSLLGPVLLLVIVVVAVAAVLVGSATDAGKSAAAGSPSASAKASASAAPAPRAPPKPALAKLIEGRAPETLTVSELLQLDDARAEKERDAAQDLRARLGKEPEAVKDKTVLRELLKYSNNPETARDAMAAMAALSGPLGPDMLYEIWTGTQARTDTTELARALLHTRDVRSKASPALAVALELRQAGDDCEKNKELLPRALKDGDKRLTHLLLKLQRKQGCGPKKKDDCFQCLRAGADLDGTINAVKARKAPSPFTP